MQEMVPDYGKLCYDDKSVANILSLPNLVNKYRVTYDSHQNDAFTVHTNRGITKFRRNKQGLYVFNPTYTTEKSNVVTTLEGNMVGFTSIKIDRAKLDSKIYNNVGLPTVKNFKNVVSTNMISKCSISVADIRNSEKIYMDH